MASITVTENNKKRAKVLTGELKLLKEALVAMEAIKYILGTASNTIDELNFKISHTESKIKDLS